MSRGTSQTPQSQNHEQMQIIKSIKFNHQQNITPQKSSTLLLKKAARAATIQDIIKAQKFYRDDSTLITEIEVDTKGVTDNVNQPQQQQKNQLTTSLGNKLLMKDPKKLEKALNQLKVINKKAERDISQTLDASEFMGTRHRLRSSNNQRNNQLNSSQNLNSLSMGFNRDVSYLYEASKTMDKSQLLQQTQDLRPQSKASSIIDLIKQEKERLDDQNKSYDQLLNENHEKIMKQNLEQIDAELYEVINKRLNSKRKPPKVQQNVDSDSQFSFVNFLESKSSLLNQQPTSRREVQILQAWFDMMINKYYVNQDDWLSLKNKEKNLNLARIQKIIDTCMKELIKQTTVICVERGQLLDQVLMINQYLQDKKIQQLKDEKMNIIKKSLDEREFQEKQFFERTQSWQDQIDQIEKKYRDELIKRESDEEIIGILRLRIKNQKYKDKKRMLNKKIQDQIRFEQNQQSMKKVSRQPFAQNLQDELNVGTTLDPNDFQQKRSRVMSLGRKTERPNIFTENQQSELEYSQSNNQDLSIRKSQHQIRVLDQSSQRSANRIYDQNDVTIANLDHSNFIDKQSSLAYQNEDLLSQEAFHLIAKDDGRTTGFEDEEDMYIRKQIEAHQLQEEMIRGRDFTYILGRVDELCQIYKNQMPGDKWKSDKQNEFIKEIIRQLFKNEIEIISQYSAIFYERQRQLTLSNGFTNNADSSRKTSKLGGVSNAVYLNNPNYTKRKMIVQTFDMGLQTEEN
eukprot:403355027